MEVPTTLVVTNDFPPRVGGIQRTLEALVRALPGNRVGVFCPTADGANEYDAEAPFAVFRQPERSLFPTRDVGQRVRAAAGELGAEVVLFGATSARRIRWPSWGRRWPRTGIRTSPPRTASSIGCRSLPGPTRRCGTQPRERPGSR